MKHLLPIFTIAMTVISGSCGRTATASGRSDEKIERLTDSIWRLISESPGEIGVAAIFDDGYTFTANDRNVYPMMSVFKMHQAVAICDDFDRRGCPLDSVISFSRDSLDPATWSPMLREHTEEEISLPVKELLRYTLTQSDNNASNLMFDRLVDVNTTDSIMARIIPPSFFRIAYTEHEMAADHSKAYANSTSALGAAILINRLFTDTVVSTEKQRFITRTLGECVTGQDRIAAPLSGKEGVKVAHKTGSGYSENGILAAHNDVAYVTLPDGRGYSLAVFVKDFKGNEKEAAEAIARISEIIYNFAAE